MAIKVGQRDTGAVTILDLTGKLAGDAGDTLADTVDTLLKGGRNQLVFNLADVSFVDSASLGRLLSLRSCVIGDGGKIKLLNPSERISDLLSLLQYPARREVSCGLRSEGTPLLRLGLTKQALSHPQ